MRVILPLDYRKAAEQDNAQAQTNLAVCYAKGMGLKQDQQEASVWFRKAAENGDSKGQYFLGRCYIQGIGVEKDQQ